MRRVREAMLRLVHPVEARISPDGRAVAVAAAGPETSDWSWPRSRSRPDRRARGRMRSPLRSSHRRSRPHPA
ncbi:hypothetical protein [Streptomyces sp. NBC_00057]|uniref:hypothetical protein n=1 Tax=Streptomyces sp. NBC_00057 TaxID=2975634 RepID=UPI00324A33D4